MQINKPLMSLSDMKENENARAAIAKQECLIEYMAIMADIDLPAAEAEVTESEVEADV